MTEIVHRAFWDSLQEQLNSDPPNYSHAVLLLQEVKTVSIWHCKGQKESTNMITNLTKGEISAI